MKRLTTSIIFIFFIFQQFTFAQISKISEFRNYRIITVDINKIYQLTQQHERQSIRIQIDKWEIDLEPSNLLHENFGISYASGKKDMGSHAIPYIGFSSANGKVALTIDDGFILGYIEEEGAVFYIEPYKYYSLAAKNNEFIIYKASDVINEKEHFCKLVEIEKENHHQEKNKDYRVSGACYKTQYALCSDYSMWLKYGSGTSARMIAITNLMITNYDNDFPDEISFEITGQYIVDCVGCDPWLTTDNASTYLSRFRSWSNTQLCYNYDISSLWTNKYFTQGIVGIAYLSGVCHSNSRNNVIRDYTTNTNSMRCVLSHELGHNFNAPHVNDATKIMNPTVSSSNIWAQSTIDTIEDKYLNNGACLSDCADTSPEVSFLITNLIISEDGNLSGSNECSDQYQEIIISVGISEQPMDSVQVSLSTAYSYYFTENTDYKIINSNVIFTNTSSLTQDFTIHVFDDQVVESDEYIKFDIQIDQGTAVVGNIKSSIINVMDNDTTCCDIDTYAATVQGSNSSSHLPAYNGEVHFYTPEGLLIASISNVDYINSDCVIGEISSDGNGKLNFGFSTDSYDEKSFHITGLSNLIYDLTIYYTDDELAIWSPNASSLKVAKSAVPLISATISEVDVSVPLEIISNVGNGNITGFKVRHQGDGYFAITDAEKTDNNFVVENADFAILESGHGFYMNNVSMDSVLVVFDGDAQSGYQAIINPDPNLEESTIYDANIYIYTEGKGLIFSNDGDIEFPWIKYALDGSYIYSELLVDLPANLVIQEKGSVSLAGTDKTIIFRSFGGECYKLVVNADGFITAVSTLCP